MRPATEWSRNLRGKLAVYGMPKHELIEERLTHSVIGASYEVYNKLGFGFLESIYIAALEHELVKRGHRVAREVSFQIVYDGYVLGIQRVDMVVDEKLIVETKSTQELNRAAARQVFSYLRTSNLRVGLLFHFGPEPRFYRYFSRAAISNSSDPLDQNYPDGT